MCWTFLESHGCVCLSICKVLRQVNYARGTLIMCDILWITKLGEENISGATISTLEESSNTEPN